LGWLARRDVGTVGGVVPTAGGDGDASNEWKYDNIDSDGMQGVFQQVFLGRKTRKT